jgi:hypothetical protein
MKNTFLKYIKITLALVLFLQVGEVSGQGFVNWTLPTLSTTQGPVTGTYPGGTVTISLGATGSNLTFKNSTGMWYTNLNGAVAPQGFGTSGPRSVPSKSLIFTFSTPVTINELNIADIDVSTGWNDSFDFSGITFTSVSATGLTATVTGATGGADTGTSTEYAKWLTSTTPISSFSIVFRTTSGLTHADLFYSMKVTNPCAALATAPTLSATTINNSSCASPYINLNSLVSTTPTGATLQWYTDNTRTTAVADPTTVNASGTYYAFYYDATNNCYSPASAAVTATYTVCPLNIATVCPAVSVDLASRVTDTAPSGYSYTYHSTTPATTANKLTSSVVTTSGTYYIANYFEAQDCYTDTSRPIVVTITDCCATLTPPIFNN